MIDTPKPSLEREERTFLAWQGSEPGKAVGKPSTPVSLPCIFQCGVNRQMVFLLCVFSCVVGKEHS